MVADSSSLPDAQPLIAGLLPNVAPKRAPVDWDLNISHSVWPLFLISETHFDDICEMKSRSLRVSVLVRRHR